MRNCWKRRASSFYVLLLAACSATHAETDSGSTNETVRIPVTIETNNGSVIFQAEVVDTPSERSMGLMYRERLGELEGMLFLFPKEVQQSFWMKNTLIPLDIIFIRADRTVLGFVENAEPKTTKSRLIPGKSQFVLEVQGGTAKRLGIEADQEVRFMAPIPSK